MLSYPNCLSTPNGFHRDLDGPRSAGQGPAVHSHYVDSLYRNLLDRPAYTSDRTFFGDLLYQGFPRHRVVRAIVESWEYRVHQVQRLHRKLLGRPAELMRLISLVNALHNGSVLEAVQAYLLGLPEYFHGQGERSNSGFLAALYHDVLRRDLDPANLARYWHELATGVPRSNV